MVGDGDRVLEEDRQELPPAGRRHARLVGHGGVAHQVDGRNVFHALGGQRGEGRMGVVKLEGDAVVPRDGFALGFAWLQADDGAIG